MGTITEAYLDAPVFIASIVNTDTQGEKARAILQAVTKNRIQGYTATLTFDEVVHIVKKLAGSEFSVPAGEYFLRIQNLKFIEVTHESIVLAQEVIKKYNLKPRDAIHVACALQRKILLIVSDDTDFDKVKELKRKGIADMKL